MDRQFGPDRSRISSDHNWYSAVDSMVSSLDEEHWRNECISNHAEFDRENNKHAPDLEGMKRVSANKHALFGSLT